MWIQNLVDRSKTSQLAKALLNRPILPPATLPYARASAILTAEAALKAEEATQRVIFLVPPPVDGLIEVLTASVLMAHLVHQPVVRSSTEDELSKLIEGDVLVVSHTVGPLMETFRQLHLGRDAITRIWPIERLSRYSPVTDGKPRVFVANPGWVLGGLADRPVGALIVDASHPRTLGALPQILACVPNTRIQTIIMPPVLERDLSILGYPERAHVWLWDSSSQRLFADQLTGHSSFPRPPAQRHHWRCDDEAVNELLLRAHEMLAQLHQAVGRRAPQGLWEAWAIYHRLRQLTVPLAVLEESSAVGWGSRTLRSRIQGLHQRSPDGMAGVLWPGFLGALEQVYERFRAYQEPPKFWSVAERLQALLRNGTQIRVVLPTEAEATLLDAQLRDVVDGWAAGKAQGFISLVTGREEARLVAQGDLLQTLLVGFRTGSQRYLDLFPQQSIEVLGYPYELKIDKAHQDYAAEWGHILNDDYVRSMVLSQLGIAPRPPAEGKKVKRDAPVVIQDEGAIGQASNFVRVFTFEPGVVELDSLLSSGEFIAWDDEPRDEGSTSKETGTALGPNIRITFEDGRRTTYRAGQSVYVYYHEVDQIQVYPPSEILKGMRVIRLVDAAYDSIHERMLEACPHSDSMIPILLRGWQHAKTRALRRHAGNRMELYQALRAQGLQVEYQAVVSYFSPGDIADQSIAPLKYQDMAVMARYSRYYQSEQEIQLTFNAIRCERDRRRKVGRHLHSLLRAIVGGEHYEQALAHARDMLGQKGSDVLSAVELVTVRHIARVS